jgi:hypothetical protein
MTAAAEDGKPKFGRRATNADEKDDRPVGAPMSGWGEESQAKDDTVIKGGSYDLVDMPTLDAGVDEASLKPREDEDMSREVATAPVEYHTAMPKLAELDSGTKWSKFLSSRSTEGFDISVLTNVLCGQLDDEDVAWNPDLLLVQLTSELLDSIEKRPDVDGTSTATGDEGIRKRGEKK